METQDQHDRHTLTAEPAIDTSPIDNSDDPWLDGNDNPPSQNAHMTSAQRDGGLSTSRDGLKAPTRSANAMRARGAVEGREAFNGNSLVSDPETLRRQWESVQVGFVDDPRRAVDDAERLVSKVVEELVDSFRLQREQLEASWSDGSEASINDLREAFQSYRDFFERLLQI